MTALAACPSCGTRLADTNLGALHFSLIGDSAWHGRRIDFTGAELTILEAMIDQPGVYMRKEALENLIHSTAIVSGTNTVAVIVSRLRGKFRAVDPHFDRIESQWNRGYRWRAS